MGACAGKGTKLRATKKAKENNPHVDSSSILPKDSPVPVDGVANGQLEEDHQNNISDALARMFPPRVISVCDSELEIELANLIYGHPEHDYTEQPITANSFVSTEV